MTAAQEEPRPDPCLPSSVLKSEISDLRRLWLSPTGPEQRLVSQTIPASSLKYEFSDFESGAASFRRNSLRIRTYADSTTNPFRIRTYESRLFTSQKRPGSVAYDLEAAPNCTASKTAAASSEEACDYFNWLSVQWWIHDLLG